MTTLTVTSKGQVTLKKELLQHLGVRPGEKIEVNMLPDGRLSISAVRRKRKIDDFFGILAGKTDKVATIEEMNEAIRRGWAGLK
ncbi:MAG: AbrB/MazE/SpoVT family DNA-binding domain-containing protein [Pararhizobium sp.]